jgi:hypothetical protein
MGKNFQVKKDLALLDGITGKVFSYADRGVPVPDGLC